MGILAPVITALQSAATCPYDASVAAQAQTRSAIATALQTAIAADGYPSWRDPTWPIHSVETIPGTQNTLAKVWTKSTGWASNLLDSWNGLAADENLRWWSVFGGGHGEWHNPTAYLDLAQTPPTWVVVSTGSDASAVFDANKVAIKPAGPYYLDGRPVSRHTYRSTVFVPGRFTDDGKDRVFTVGDYAAYMTGYEASGYFVAGPQVDAWRIADATHDPAGTWPNTPYQPPLSLGTAINPRNGRVYVASGDSTKGDRLRVRDPLHGTWSTLLTTPLYPSQGRMLAWEYAPVIVDTKRNRLVAPMNQVASPALGWILQTVDLATGAVSNVKLTGDLVSAGTPHDRQMVHDLDNDVYLFFDSRGYPGTSATLYKIDPTTGVSTALGALAVPLASIDGRAEYIPALGGAVYLAGSGSPLQFVPTR